MKKVSSLGDKTNDATYVSPRQALENALESLGKQGEGSFEKGKKLLVLCLDDTEKNFRVSFINSNLKMSEAISVCEVAKSIFLKEMNY